MTIMSTETGVTRISVIEHAHAGDTRFWVKYESVNAMGPERQGDVIAKFRALGDAYHFAKEVIDQINRRTA